MKVKIVIDLLIECPENSDAVRAVEALLDAGTLQREIETSNEGTDYAAVRVLRAVMT